MNEDVAKRLARLSEQEQRALLAQLLRKKLPKQKKAPISFSQERLWFLYQLDPNNTAHNTFNAIQLSGALDVKGLEQCFNLVIARHEILRTTFSTMDGQTIQVIAPTLELSLPLIELGEMSEAQQKARLQQLAAEEAQRPFDLALGPLVRATLVCITETRHILLLSVHHIISDNWSVGVLLYEMMSLYKTISAPQGSAAPSLSPLPLQYADFAVWQREWLQGEVLATQRAYWQQQLANMAALELPTDRLRPDQTSYYGTTHSWMIGPALTRDLKSLAQRENISLFMVLLAGFVSLLYRYTGQIDITLRSPVANRMRKELESLIGYFANTLALRVKLSHNPTFRELLGRVNEVCLEAYAHQDIPFEKALEDVQLAHRQGGGPLFPVMFVFQNAPMPMPDVPGLRFESLDLDDGMAPFELTVLIREIAGGLRGKSNYNTELFEASSIQRMTEHFQRILESVVAAPDQRLDSLVNLIPAGQIPAIRSQSGRKSEHVTPRTPAESTLAGIWKEVLRVEQIGIHDSFFKSGGDSLSGMQVVSKANQAGLHFTPRQLFQHPTIAELAAISATTQVQAEQGMITGEAQFTHSQVRFIRHRFPSPHWWNTSHFFKLDRALAGPTILEQALQQVILHHDALRMRFVVDETGWKQFIAPPDAVQNPILTVVDLSEKPLKERGIAMLELAAKFQESLNLTDGPTLRVIMFDLGEYKPYNLLIIIHHLVADAVSFKIIVQDIAAACQQLSHGEPVQFPPKTTSLKQWAESIHVYAQSAAFLREQEQYLALPWDQAGPLPIDRPGGREQNTMGSHDLDLMSLNPEETEILLKELPRLHNVQPFEALVTALAQSITRWTGRPWMILNTLNTGRMMDIPESENLDLSRTVGWLSTHYLLLLKRCETDDAFEALKSIQAQLLQLPGQGYSDDIAQLSPTYSTEQSLPAYVNDLRLNYIGQGGKPTSTGLQSTDLPTGATSDPECHEDHILGCVVSAVGKRLYLAWDYSRNCYEKETIKNVTQDFMKNLRAIIAHCKPTTN